MSETVKVITTDVVFETSDGKLFLSLTKAHDWGEKLEAAPELRTCWYQPHQGPLKGEWTGGKFHQWGMEKGSAEGEGNFSIGIVEDSMTGDIATIEPERITFGLDPRFRESRESI